MRGWWGFFLQSEGGGGVSFCRVMGWWGFLLQGEGVVGFPSAG